MRNNNGAIVKKLIKRSLASNKKRNVFVIIAITLTTLLLSSVLSIGMSFLESLEMQSIRLMGTAAHAAVSRPSEDELEQLKNLDYVKIIGTGNHVALINNTAQMGDMNLSLHYFDNTEWTELRVPANTGILGKYPQKENEVMIPYWILERLGIEPQIGMEFPICYTVENGGEYVQYDEVFILSGWFTGYTHIRSGNIDSILVSEALSQRHGKTIGDEGAATLVFESNSRVDDYCERIIWDLSISDSKRVRPVPMYAVSDSDSTTTFIAILLVIIFLMFTGYLLIYNVLYISVSRDVRFYGLLKTVGATPKQIRRIVTGQILRLCAAGIPLGEGIASLLSLAIIPALVSKTSAGLTGIIVSFSPLIFIGAAIFALLTAFLGAAKPAKMAADVSPIEAQKFTGSSVTKSAVYSPANGKAYKMASRNIFRDRKRASIVLLSLFLGVTTFIVITSIVSGMDTDNYIATYVSDDFVLTNNTVSIGSTGESKQKFDDAFLSEIAEIPGFENMHYDTTGRFYLTYTDDFDAHLKSHLSSLPNQKEPLSPEEFSLFKERVIDNFVSIAVGVDSDALLELDGDFDAEAFERGEYLLLAAGDPSLLEDIKLIEVRSDLEGEALGTIAVNGFTPIFFHNNGYSNAPTLIMSNNLMEKWTGGAMRSKLYIEVAEGYDTLFLDALKAITDGDYEISRISRLEAQGELSDAKMMLYILGGGIAIVLGLIGVLNFINVMSVGIVVRKRELATLESIGMARGQTRAMLLYEGLGYAIITFLLVSTFGTVLTYGIFKLFQQQADYAVFTYPILPVAIAAFAILAVCIITPEIVYRSVNKKSIAERLREAE